MSLCKEREFGKVKEYTVHLDVVSDDDDDGDDGDDSEFDYIEQGDLKI